MLFADATADGTWVAVAIAAVSALSGVSQVLISRRYDAKISALERDVAACAEKHAECETQHQLTRSELSAAKEELKARDARDRQDLQHQIDVLKRQVEGRDTPRSPDAD